RDGEFPLTVLLGEERSAGGDATEHGHRTIRGPGGARIDHDERARRALGRLAPLEHALALECAEMIERRARRALDPLANHTHRGRDAVPHREGADEIQDVALATCQLPHSSAFLVAATILNAC